MKGTPRKYISVYLRASSSTLPLLPIKTTRTSSGVQVMMLKKGQTLRAVYDDFTDRFEDTKGYKKIKIPATGILLSEKDITKQQLKI